MNSNKAIILENYTHLLDQISDLLSLSLSDIRNMYADYPHCLMDYFEKDVTEKSIEIRFDEQEVTTTCTFNPEGNCNMVYLFSDNTERIENLIDYLKDKYEYDFIKNRWSASGYHICIKEASYPPYDVYVLFYS